MTITNDGMIFFGKVDGYEIGNINSAKQQGVPFVSLFGGELVPGIASNISYAIKKPSKESNVIEPNSLVIEYNSFVVSDGNKSDNIWTELILFQDGNIQLNYSTNTITYAETACEGYWHKNEDIKEIVKNSMPEIGFFDGSSFKSLDNDLIFGTNNEGYSADSYIQNISLFDHSFRDGWLTKAYNLGETGMASESRGIVPYFKFRAKHALGLLVHDGSLDNFIVGSISCVNLEFSFDNSGINQNTEMPIWFHEELYENASSMQLSPDLILLNLDRWNSLQISKHDYSELMYNPDLWKAPVPGLKIILNTYFDDEIELRLDNIRMISNQPASARLILNEAVPQPSKFFVDQNVIESGDGRSWNTAFKTIYEAVVAVENLFEPAEIHISEGKYTGNIYGTINNNVHFYGGYNSDHIYTGEKSLVIVSGDLSGNDDYSNWTFGTDLSAPSYYSDNHFILRLDYAWQEEGTKFKASFENLVFEGMSSPIGLVFLPQGGDFKNCTFRYNYSELPIINVLNNSYFDRCHFYNNVSLHSVISSQGNMVLTNSIIEGPDLEGNTQPVTLIELKEGQTDIVNSNLINRYGSELVGIEISAENFLNIKSSFIHGIRADELLLLTANIQYPVEVVFSNVISQLTLPSTLDNENTNGAPAIISEKGTNVTSSHYNFVDVQSGDFNLVESSFAVDGSENSTMYEYAIYEDFYGRKRPFDGNNDGINKADIGAVEYYDPSSLLAEVSVNVNDALFGSISSTANQVQPLEIITITAQANEGYTFESWTMSPSNCATIVDVQNSQFLIYDDCNITANFSTQMFPVNITVIGNGTVAPSEEVWVQYGTDLELNAFPIDDALFIEWRLAEGSNATIENPTHLMTHLQNVLSEIQVIAEFTDNFHDLQIQTENGGAVVIAGNSYLNGDVVQIGHGAGGIEQVQAVADDGFSFSHWVFNSENGEIVSSYQEITQIMLNADGSLTAVFDANDFQAVDGCGINDNDLRVHGLCNDPEQEGPDFNSIWVANDQDYLYFLIRACSPMGFEQNQTIYLNTIEGGFQSTFDKRIVFDFVRNSPDTTILARVENWNSQTNRFEFSSENTDESQTTAAFRVNSVSQTFPAPNTSFAAAKSLIEVAIPLPDAQIEVDWLLRGSHDDIGEQSGSANTFPTPYKYMVSRVGNPKYIDGMICDWIDESCEDLFELNVVNGLGSGLYPAGAPITISAQNPVGTEVFEYWSGHSLLNGATSPAFTGTMPNENVTVTANFNFGNRLYHLNVVNGIGGGDYSEGALIAVQGREVLENEEFIGWTGDIQYLEDPNSFNTIVSIPDENISITANYKNLINTVDLSNIVNNQTEIGISADGATEIVFDASNFVNGGLATIINDMNGAVKVEWFGTTGENTNDCGLHERNLTLNGENLANFGIAKTADGKGMLSIRSIDGSPHNVRITIQNWQNSAGCVAQ